MASPEASSEGGPAGGDPTSGRSGVFAELAAAFRRKRPQGTARWNFAAAFTKLDEAFGSEHRKVLGGDAPQEAPAAERSGAKALVHRHVLERLRPWVSEQAEAAARRALVAELGRVEGGLESTVEAFRFLAARVEELEDHHRRGAEPVDGMAWLVPAPELGGWVAAVADRLQEHGGPPGPVLHAECGDGAFIFAVAQAFGAGLDLRGCEPRGAAGLAAGRSGLSVHVGPVTEALAASGAGTLGAVVLSGVVDRSTLSDLVAVVDATVTALGKGGTLVVVGTVPEQAATSWGPVAADLVPGRPLHAETWSLLLERVGFRRVAVLEGGDGATWAVAGTLAP